MNTIKKATLTLSLFWGLSGSFAQGIFKEHLEPTKDFKEYTGNLKIYYDSMLPMLYKDFSEKPTARFFASPAYIGEYAFSIEVIKDKYYVVSNSMSENYWYSKKRNDVQLKSNKKEIEGELYNKIGELFLTLDQNTAKHDEEKMDTNGTTYYFSSTNKEGKVLTGEAWSPSEKTLMSQLVKICDNIFALGSGKKVSHEDLIKDIDKFMADIKA